MELPRLTLVVEREVKPSRWRPFSDPLCNLECPVELLHQLYSTGDFGVPPDIGQDTIRLLFIPLKKQTSLDEEGEIVGLSVEDANHEVKSWGAVMINNHMIFATQEDFTTLHADVFQSMTSQVQDADKLEFVQVILQHIESLKNENLSFHQIRVILVMS
jgi:hypothetical protein